MTSPQTEDRMTSSFKRLLAEHAADVGMRINERCGVLEERFATGLSAKVEEQIKASLAGLVEAEMKRT